MRNWGLFLFTLAIAIILAVMASTPPGAQGPDTPSDEFSSARAMVDVRIISAAPHPPGTAEHAKVRAYLQTRLEDIGFEVTISESEMAQGYLERLNRWSGEDAASMSIYNIIGVLPGEDRSKKPLLLMAHYDTVWGSPGAADDTIGVAAILEITRALSLEDRSRDIVVLFTDAEEIGLVGARQFYSENPLSDRIGAVINFEARGGGGTANMFQTSAQNGDAMRLYAKSVSQPAASSLSTFVYSILPNDTDLTPALKRDYIAYNFANIGRAGYYHSPEITPDALSENTLQHMGVQGLGLSRALIGAELPAKSKDAVFFDAYGLFTVLYSAGWGWVFLFICAACFIASMKGRANLKQTLFGSLKMVILLGAGAIGLYLLNKLSGSGASSNYYDRLAAINRLEITAAFFALAILGVLLSFPKMSVSGRFGFILPVFLIGIAGQYFAPTATYFISIPLLFAGVILVLQAKWPGSGVTSGLTVLLSAAALGYMIYLGHYLMLGVGADMMFVVILPIAIGAMMIVPATPQLSKRAGSALSVAALLVSVGVALWVRLDPIASTVPLY